MGNFLTHVVLTTFALTKEHVKMSGMQMLPILYSWYRRCAIRTDDYFHSKSLADNSTEY